MAADEEVVALVTMDAHQFNAGIQQISKAMNALQQGGQKSFAEVANSAATSGQKIASAFSRIDFRGQLTELDALAQGFLRFGKTVIDASGKQDQYLATLRQVTGSVGGAQSELRIFQEEAKKSSFSIDDIVTAGARLRAQGMGLDPAVKSLKQARDVAAFLGEDLKEISGFLARARRGDQDALTVLQERGIVTKEQLRKLGAAYDRGTLAIKAVTTDQKEKLGDALDQGLSRVAGSDELRVNTLAGQVSNLQDEMTKAGAAVGGTMTPALKELAGAVRSGVDAFNSMEPSSKALVGNMLLVGGAIAAATVVISALAGPIGTVLAVGSSLVTAFLLPAPVALLPVALAIEKVGLSCVAFVGGMTAMKAALIATKAVVLGFGVAVAYMAVEMVKTNKVLKEFDKDFGDRDKALKKVERAVGGLGGFAKTSAAQLKELGVTSADMVKALGGLQDVDDSQMGPLAKKQLHEKTRQVRQLAIELKDLEKAEAFDPAKVNALEDPGSRDLADKADLKKQLDTLDAEGASTQKRLNVLNQILKTNKLVLRDDETRLAVQEKITKLQEKLYKEQNQASDKELNNKIKGAKAAGNQLDTDSKNASLQAAKAPKGSESAKRLEYDAFLFQRRANQARIAALQAILDKEKLTAAQKANLEQRIHSYVQKNEADRIKFIEARATAEETAQKKKEAAQKKEADDLRDSQKNLLEAQATAADRAVEEAKKRMDEGTGSQAAVEDAINQRQALQEALIKLNREDEDADAKSQEARINNEAAANLEIQQSRDEARDAIRDYDDSLRESARVTEETGQQSVAAVQKQVADTKRAFQSLDDVLQQQNDSFGIDAARARADEIDQGRKRKAAEAKVAFKKANPELVAAQAEVDRLRREAQRAAQNAATAQNRQAQEQRAKEVAAKQTAGLPKAQQAPMPAPLSASEAKRVATTAASDAAQRAAKVADRAANAPQSVNVRVEVTVKDSRGNQMAQEGPAKVTIGGRGGESKLVGMGMPYSTGGGLSAGVGMG